MFGFIKKIFIGLLNTRIIGQFGESLDSYYKGPIKCVSLNNQPCQTRPKLIDINSNETLLYPYNVNVH